MKALIVENGTQRGTVVAVRSLARAGWDVGVASVVPAHASRSRSCRWRHEVPPAHQDRHSFVTAVGEVARSNSYDLVLAGGDEELLALSGSQPAGTTIGHPPGDVVGAALDKAAMMELADKGGLAIPKEGDLGGGPVIVKSRCHSPGEKDRARTRLEPLVARTRTELDEALASFESAGLPSIVQSYVVGPLIALSLVIDRRGQVVTAAQQLAETTWPPGRGVSTRAVTMRVDETLLAQTRDFLRDLGWFGIAELQFIAPDAGPPRLIDLNGRFYGSLALAVGAGADLPAAHAALFTAEPSPPSRGVPGVRYQWLEGDIRRVLADDDQGRVGGLLGCWVRAFRSVHSLWSWRDPGPALVFALRLAARAPKKLLGRA